MKAGDRQGISGPDQKGKHMTEGKTRPVVVTTEHRGVFFGFAPAGEISLHPADAKSLTLTDAQMCVYWSEDVKGILGLAAGGPTVRCRVTRRVGRITITEVTSVIDATGEAVKAWQDRPWS
jgi:hypothetical protein